MSDRRIVSGMRRATLLAAAALAVALLAPLPASALDLATLQPYVGNDIEACLEGDEGKCEAAAARVGDPVWAAWLRGDQPTGLSLEDERRLYALQCAGGDDGGCARFAAELLLSGDAVAGMRAARIAHHGCLSGNEASCLIWRGAVGEHPETFRMELGESSVFVDQLLFGYPDPGWLDDAASSCAVHPTTCASVFRAFNLAGTRLGSSGGFEEWLPKACKNDPGGIACALADDRAEEPAFPELVSDTEALKHFCSQGLVEAACSAAAALVDFGRAQAYGSVEALHYRGYACDGGDQASCDVLTEAYDGSVGEKVQAECKSVRGGGEGDPRTCTSLFTMYTFGVGVEKDEDAALELKVKACALGDPRLCVAEGHAAWAEERYLDAFVAYGDACEAGDAGACGIAGRMTLKGEHGVPSEPAIGLQLLALGCGQGAGNACFELGYSYSQGRGGLTVDATRAAQLYERACSLGYVNGCSSLGVLYLDQRGVQQNLLHAVWMMREACERGFGSACRNLGNTYRDGLAGATVDLDKANTAYSAGCALEHQDSCTRRDELAARPEVQTGERPFVEKAPDTGQPPPIPSTTYTGATTNPPWGPGVAGPGTPPPPEDDSTPRPSPPSPQMSFRPALLTGLQLGSQRSWSDKVQAGAVRWTFGVKLPYVALGGELDWVSDNRWRPKAARTYWRLGLRGFAAFAVPLPGPLSIWLGGGGAVGGYRRGPGTTNDVTLAGGAYEFVQFNITAGEGFFMGVRIEQQQLQQEDAAMPLDHVTAGTLLIGAKIAR